MRRIIFTCYLWYSLFFCYFCSCYYCCSCYSFLQFFICLFFYIVVIFIFFVTVIFFSVVFIGYFNLLVCYSGNISFIFVILSFDHVIFVLVLKAVYLFVCLYFLWICYFLSKFFILFFFCYFLLLFFVLVIVGVWCYLVFFFNFFISYFLLLLLFLVILVPYPPFCTTPNPLLSSPLFSLFSPHQTSPPSSSPSSPSLSLRWYSHYFLLFFLFPSPPLTPSNLDSSHLTFRSLTSPSLPQVVRVLREQEKLHPPGLQAPGGLHK